MITNLSDRAAEIRENLRRIRAEIEEAAVRAGRDPAAVRLMAVTKTVPAELVNVAIADGVHLLGENRAQELCEKYPDYDKAGVEIHFIGRLQTNKVRQIIDKVDMVHSVDSQRLAAELNRQAQRAGKICDVLLEVNIGGEASKSGVAPEDLAELAEKLRDFPHLRRRGLMTIPTICDTIGESERYFSRMEELFIDIRDKNRDNKDITILSMGMSDDFSAAIRRGSTLVRVGTAIFGGRV
jgi:pyridoxal phosphate enzyme (YggS family)